MGKKWVREAGEEVGERQETGRVWEQRVEMCPEVGSLPRILWFPG